MALQTSPVFSALLDLIKWAKKPLQYSVNRVNTLRISPKEALEKVRVDLARQAANLGRPTPAAQLHPRIPDAIIISAWPNLKPLLEPPPDRPEYPAVFVDTACGHAVLRGAHVYSGGTLGISEIASIGDTVSVYVMHRGIRRWIAYGKLCSLPLSPKELEARPQDDNCIVEISEGMSVLPSLCTELIRAGLLLPQSLPSILASHILSAQPGDHVLVLGNDNGLLTSHVAALTSNKADIVTVNESKRRLEVIIKRCKLTGAKVTQVLPSAKDLIENETVKFDCVVVSPDHSCYGARPCIEDIFFDGREVNSNTRPVAETAVKLLKPGGRLVYYTRSAMPLECDAVLRWLLDHSNVKLITTEPRLAPVGLQCPIPLASWMKLSAQENKLIQRFGPHLEELESDPVVIDAPSGFIACLTVTH